jgi:Zn-dependent peptidase ImmA (M78 family)
MNRRKWPLTDEEYEFIKGEVIHLFKKYKIKCIPISGFEIATKMGITMIPYSSLKGKRLKKALEISQDGFYCEENGIEYIYYNNIKKSYKRQNMTILHEIGHCVLDHTGHSEKEEAEANFFAKYAIAPPPLIHRIGATSPFDIYCAFDISEEASKYAYEYYITWKDRYYRIGKMSLYEQTMVKMFNHSIQKYQAEKERRLNEFYENYIAE